MAKALTDLRMTVAEFTRWHDGTDTRHELVDGRPVAMVPPSGRHAVITRSIFRALDRRLKEPCGAMFGAGVARDLAEGECRMPDLSVTREPMPEHVVLNARLVVEVMAPSTEGEDRTDKLDFYKFLPTVEAIVLVWQDRRRVQLHTREDPRWPAQDFTGSATVPLTGLGVELPLDEIYAGVEFPAPPSRGQAADRDG